MQEPQGGHDLLNVAILLVNVLRVVTARVVGLMLNISMAEWDPGDV